jgi:SAM-dependent methyltransferase
MIQKSWFDSLMKLGLRKQHSWLANLPSKIEYIANFGCWSGGEPFSLIWTLDAKEVMVVEIEQKNLKELFKEHDIVRSRYPESLQERTIKTVCRDMTKPLPELPNQHYDLAYCENVLYSLHLQGSTELLEKGILQMIRVVKQNGFIVAAEPNFGVEFETKKVHGVDMSTSIPKSAPKDLSPFFELKGLKKLLIPNSPTYAYCYQKL